MQLLRRVLQAEAAQSGDDGAASSASASDGASPRPLLTCFLKLLSFWCEVYSSHSCERRFLEFSSGVPFERWRRVVDALKADLRIVLAELDATS